MSLEQAGSGSNLLPGDRQTGSGDTWGPHDLRTEAGDRRQLWAVTRQRQLRVRQTQGRLGKGAQVPFHVTGSVLERKAGFPLTNVPKPWYFASESFLLQGFV